MAHTTYLEHSKSKRIAAPSELGWLAIVIAVCAFAVLAVVPSMQSEDERSAEALARVHIAPMLLAAPAGTAFEVAQERSSPVGRHVSFVQTHDGVPILDSGITVTLGQRDERLFVMGSVESVTGVADRKTTVSPGGATQIALQDIGADSVVSAEPVQQVYFMHEDGRLQLAWRVMFHSLRPLGDWDVLVAANNGEILLKRNLAAFDHPVSTGTVFDPNPITTSGGLVPPPTDCETPANAATLAPYVVTRPLQGITTGQGALTGQYVDTTHQVAGPIASANEPTHVYSYACNDARFEEVNVYHHMDSVQRLVQSLGFTGTFGIQDSVQDTDVHMGPSCVAFYSPGADYIGFGDGDASCYGLPVPSDTAEDSDIVVHEYAHAMMFDIVTTGATSFEAGAWAEGFGDLIAALYFQNPCMYEWRTSVIAGLGAPCWRNLDTGVAVDTSLLALGEFTHYPEDIHSDPHLTGTIWSGAMWDIYQKFGGDTAARDKTLRLALQSLFYWGGYGGSGTLAEAAALARQADIDLYGGADLLVMDTAFAAHGIFPHRWTIGGALDINLSQHRSVRLLNGKVLVTASPGSVETRLFDPATSTFSAASDMPATHSYGAASVLRDGRVIVTGGELAAVNTVHIYNPNTNTWSAGANMGTARAEHGSAVLPDGRLLVFGGSVGAGSTAIASAEIYNPTTNSWSPTAPLVAPRKSFAAVTLGDGRILASGGIDVSFASSKASETYNPTTGTWTTVGTLTTPRYLHTGTLLPDGRVLVVGGNDGTTPLSSAEIFDPATNSWSLAAALPVSRDDHATVLLPTGMVLVAGGDLNPQPSSPNAYLYHPGTNVWLDADWLNYARGRHTLTLLHDGRVLAVGGDDYPNPTPTFNYELFTSCTTPGDANNDRNFVDNSPPYLTSLDDKTLPVSDGFTDACDGDDDNDGLADYAESLSPTCPAASAATNPLLRDTDGDRFLDGVECRLGFNPNSASSTPPLTACGPVGDPDGDKIQTRIEVCYYNSNPSNNDSDGDVGMDGSKDGCEMASFNSDRVVNSVDQAMLAQGMGALGYTVNVDINKDGTLNSIDQAQQAQFITPPGQCP